MLSIIVYESINPRPLSILRLIQDGHTALDMARAFHNPECVALLKCAAASGCR